MWCTFEPSSIEDETINNAFSTNGLFKICTENPVEKIPHVLSFVQGDRIVVAIGNCLSLVLGEGANECNTVQFETNINALAVSCSGQIVICGLSDGTVHGIHVSGTSLFCLNISAEDVFEDGSFVGLQKVSGDEFYLLTKYGKVYKVCGIDEKVVNESLLMKTNETLLGDAVLERVVNVKRGEANCFLVTEIDGEVLLMVNCGGELFFYCEGRCSRLEVNPFKAIFDFENYIVGLSVEGTLSIICPFTKSVQELQGLIRIENLLILESNSNEIELLTLSQPDQDGDRCMKIVDFPSMKAKNELILQDSIWLVRQPKASVNIYYISANKENDGFKEVEMRLVCENEPTQRLKKLIQRGLYTEAEEFALQYELSVQPIHEARARTMCNAIKTGNKDTFNDLLKLLNIIESQLFLTSITDFEFPERSMTESFLKFLLSKLNANENLKHIKRVNEKILRIETLKLIDPTESDVQWREFVHHRDLKDLCMKNFKINFMSACLIWSRHTSSILPYLEENHIVKILNAIPASVEPIEVIHWLKHFVPSILQVYPNFMSALVTWCISRTKSFQFSPHWPDIGLEFMNNIQAILRDVGFLYSNVQRKYESHLETIADTIMSLEDLSVLKTIYSLPITLDDYIKDSIEDTAYNLLQRVQLTNFRPLVQNFLYPIFTEKGLSPEPAILRYLLYLAKMNRNYTDWPERMKTAIDLLHNENDRLNSVLLAVRSAPIPWPEALNPLLKYADGNHPLAREIYVEYQNQTIKALRSKYGWPVDHVDQLGDRVMFIRRILLKNFPEMLDDVKIVLKASPEDATEANFYVVWQLAERNEIERAIRYVDALKVDEKKNCCERVIRTYLHLMEDGDNVDQMDLIKTLDSRINNFYSLEIEDTEKILKLKRYFDISVKGNELRSVHLLSRTLDRFLESLQENPRFDLMNAIYSKVRLLSSIFDMDFIGIGLKLCSKVDHLNFTIAFVVQTMDCLEITRSNVKFVVELAILAFRQRLVSSETESNLIFYAVLHDLLEQAFPEATLYLSEVQEMLRWTAVGRQFCSKDAVEVAKKEFLKKVKITSKMFECKETNDNLRPHANKRQSFSMFDNIKTPPRPELRSSTDSDVAFTCLNKALLLVSSSVPNFFTQLNSSNTEDIAAELISQLHKLNKVRQHMSCFVILQLIRYYDPKIEIMMLATKKTLIREILKAELNLKAPNFLKALSVLDSTTEPFDVLPSLDDPNRSEHYRLNYLQLAEMFYSIKHAYAECDLAKKSRILLLYQMELHKIDAALKYKPNLDITSNTILMKELKGKPLTVDLLQRMSKDFDWHYDETISLQIVNILMNQKLEFTVNPDVFGKEEISLKTSVDELWLQVEPYVKEVRDFTFLIEKLKENLTLFNSYFYELYLCVIRIISYREHLPAEMKLWEQILSFLQLKMSKKRRKTPGQFEKDWWLKIAPEVGVLPKISKYRLPFLPLICEPLKHTLDEEISVDNCEDWLPLIELISLFSGSDFRQDQDYFCMVAVKNSEAEFRLTMTSEESTTWHLSPVNNAFLQAVCRLTAKMFDKTKILFLLYFVTNHAAEGVDQVEAAVECYQFAVENEDELMAHVKAREIVGKIKRKYHIFKVQHLLHFYGLADDNLLSLVENPRELLRALYNHESILKDQKLNVNAVVIGVCALFGISYESVQMHLLEKWLQFQIKDDNVPESMLEETRSGGDMEGVSDESVKRAYFILKDWEPERAIRFLAGQILNEDTKYNTGKQLQLFECFTKLLDDDTHTTYEDLITPDYYNLLNSVHRLRQLGYKFDTEKFKNADKMNILKKIWTNNSHEPKGIELLCFICLAFDINEAQVWNGILKQMVKHEMIDKLSALVHILSTKSKLLHLPGLASAWIAVIKAPFKHANRTSPTEANLMKPLILLQSCPVSASLDLLELAEICLHLEQPRIAAIFLAFTRGNQKQNILNLLLPHKSPTLRTAILELKEHGINPSIVNSCLKELGI